MKEKQIKDLKVSPKQFKDRSYNKNLSRVPADFLVYVRVNVACRFRGLCTC